MRAPVIQLLLLEDNDDDAQLVQLALENRAAGEFAITRVERLADALAQIRTGHFDTMLSDLDLPDSTGLATVQAISAKAPELPLVVLTGQHDDNLGREAIRYGAHDYLLKGKSSGGHIARALHYAMESKRFEIGLRVANEALERRVAERTAELEIANKSLRQSEARFRSLTEMSSDFYWETDVAHRFTQGNTDVNLKTASVWCTPRGKRRWEIPYISPDGAGWQAHRALLDAHLPFRDFQLSRPGPDGTERYLSVSGDPLFDATGEFTGYRGVGTDITERKHAVAALARQKDLYAVLSETNQIIVRCRSREELFPAVCRLAVEHGHFLFAWIGLIDKNDQRLVPMASYGSDAGYLDELDITGNGSSASRRGLTERTLVSSAGMIDNDIVDNPVLAPRYDLGLRTGARASAKFPLRHSGTVIGAISFYSREPGYFTDDLLATLDELATDVSFALDNFKREVERRHARERLQESEERLRAIFEGALDGIMVVDLRSGNFLTANRAICRMLGYTHEEIVRISISDIHPKQELPHVTEEFERLVRGEIQMAADTPVMRKDGSVLYADINAAPIRFGGQDCLLGIFRDISERKQTERKLVESEARFRGLVDQSIAGICIIQDGKYAYVNPRCANIFGYDSADEMLGRDILSVVAEKDRGMVAKHMRERIEGEVMSNSFDFTALRKDGSMIEVGVHGTRATHGSRPAIIGLLQDISEKKQAEQKIRHYIEQLKTAFMSTVEVATIISEMRDPYTAGHERRVAQIAVAIGAELGFDTSRLEGLRVAGYLHDIGKITIPSEILSKAGKLTAIEFQLIQGHVQASYDVLKGVDFPWPVAQVALQHHERMDGSGYPQGLKGEAILLEARIIAVADVVEAMSSHRPYRAGLGIEAALSEIERGRESAYDPVVADACLKLFGEKGYALPE